MIDSRVDGNVHSINQTHALTALWRAFAARGLDVPLADGRVSLPPLSVEITVHDVEVTPGDWSIVRVEYEAAMHPGGLTVRVNAVGFGDHLHEALDRAANQWIDGVFPVLHSYVDPHPAELDVEVVEMLTATDDGERFGWRVHLGPILVTLYGEGPDPATPAKSELMQVLLNAVTGIATGREPFWLELFAGRLANGQSATTCLLQSEEWLLGDATLAEWVAGWPEEPKSFGKRQFILFEPVEADELRSRAKLEKSLPVTQPPAPSWWQRLRRRLNPRDS